MSAAPESCEFLLEPADNDRLANLCGLLDEHLRQVEAHLGIEISCRGNRFLLRGAPDATLAGGQLLERLYATTTAQPLNPKRLHYALAELGMGAVEGGQLTVRTRRGLVQARGVNQRQYLSDIREADLNFGIGPAGTGKTYLAVACGVEALETEQVRRIVLVRPAVEAGERLGFLPGDMSQKVDPYLRPIYDALYEMLGFDRVARLIDRNVIEVAPLAFMRGRTLNESFIILDEAQNTTVEQMKMFLTRIGFGSKAVVTGDKTQTDLPRDRPSGLGHASEVLRDVDGVRFTWFTSHDVVRHALVQRIVRAYEQHEKEQGQSAHNNDTRKR